VRTPVSSQDGLGRIYRSNRQEEEGRIGPDGPLGAALDPYALGLVKPMRRPVPSSVEPQPLLPGEDSLRGSDPRCRFCGTKLVHTFVDLGMSPLCENVLTTDQLESMEPFYPLHVRICHSCLLVQLPEYVPPEQIFTEYAYFSSYSDTWVEHARSYAEAMIAREKLGSSHLVVELASNDGYLLQHFARRGIPVLGIEPAQNVAAVAIERGLPTVTEFFTASLARDFRAEGRGADLLVANNVLAHVPDLNDFVEGMRTLLTEGGLLTAEFPHLPRLIEGNQFDTIYHEHFSYYSFHAIRQVLKAHGLAIVDVEQLPTHGGSLRIFAKHSGSSEDLSSGRVERLLRDERDAGYDHLEGYSSFAHRVRQAKNDLLEFLIQAKHEGKSIVGYGAPGKSTTLLNYCGIRTDYVEYTVDRNLYKQGKYLPGTHIPVLPPSHIAETQPDYVLILPWNLRDEIIGQLSYIREWSGRFVVPIPNLEVL
jgi:SAM-dependent methyltransferase